MGKNKQTTSQSSKSHPLHLLGVGAAPEDGLQSGAPTGAHRGQQDHGTAAPCECPHHRKNKRQRPQRLGIINHTGRSGSNDVASACLQVRAEEASPAARCGSPSCCSWMRIPTLCVIALGNHPSDEIHAFGDRVCGVVLAIS